MKAKFRLLSAFFVLALTVLAQRSMTVADVIAFVDSQLKLKGDDRATADFLQHVKLTQKLEIRDVEDLQGRGAGPRTLQALRKLSEDSASLAAAPPPQVVVAPPPKPPPSAQEQTAILAAMKEYALTTPRTCRTMCACKPHGGGSSPPRAATCRRATKFRRC